jgi:hypothetical protein
MVMFVNADESAENTASREESDGSGRLAVTARIGTSKRFENAMIAL